jgi:hypothetical protein
MNSGLGKKPRGRGSSESELDFNVTVLCEWEEENILYKSIATVQPNI